MARLEANPLPSLGSVCSVGPGPGLQSTLDPPTTGPQLSRLLAPEPCILALSLGLLSASFCHQSLERRDTRSSLRKKSPGAQGRKAAFSSPSWELRAGPLRWSKNLALTKMIQTHAGRHGDYILTTGRMSAEVVFSPPKDKGHKIRPEWSGQLSGCPWTG